MCRVPARRRSRWPAALRSVPVSTSSAGESPLLPLRSAARQPCRGGRGACAVWHVRGVARRLRRGRRPLRFRGPGRPHGTCPEIRPLARPRALDGRSHGAWRRGDRVSYRRRRALAGPGAAHAGPTAGTGIQPGRRTRPRPGRPRRRVAGVVPPPPPGRRPPGGPPRGSAPNERTGSFPVTCRPPGRMPERHHHRRCAHDRSHRHRLRRDAAEAGFRSVATVSFARTLRPLDGDESPTGAFDPDPSREESEWV